MDYVMPCFVLFAGVVMFVYLDKKIDPLIAELQGRNTQNIDITESKIYRQMKNRMQAERDQLYSELLEASTDLTIYKNQAEREIYQLKRTVETEREKVRTAEQALSRARAEMERLNGCKCLCNNFEVFRFCTHSLYRMATYALRRFVGSNLLLTALDYVFDQLEPQARYLQIE
jgi:hypothetical protein